MQSLYDIGKTIIQIREAANSLEVKGQQNAAYIVFIHGKCNDLIEVINEISRNANNPDPKADAEKETDGDVNERDSGVSE